MRVVILLLNNGRGSGEVARQHAKELVRLGHGVWYMHPVVGDGVEGAHNLDVQLHVDVLPVHEYLPAAGRDQRAVSNMDAAEALAYVPDYEATLEEVADDIDVFIGHHAVVSRPAEPIPTPKLERVGPDLLDNDQTAKPR